MEYCGEKIDVGGLGEGGVGWDAELRECGVSHGGVRGGEGDRLDGWGAGGLGSGRFGERGGGGGGSDVCRVGVNTESVDSSAGKDAQSIPVLTTTACHL